MVRSYELGVLFLPGLEAAYRGHRHCGFSCTAKPPVILPAGTRIIFAPLGHLYFPIVQKERLVIQVAKIAEVCW